MKLRIAYDARQSAQKNNSYSPSATKPAKVVAAWKQLGIDFDWIPVKPVTSADLEMVHDAKMVRDVLQGRRTNGFGNTLKEITDALPWVCGSMVAATFEAAEHGGTTFSATSGAHHAGYDFNGQFCTFNFLALAAKKVHDLYDLKVGILDCDMHYGNGTADIIDFLQFESWLVHHSMGKKSVRHRKYLRKLSNVLSNFQGVDIMIYNAGADSHIDDPLGGALTTEELIARDRMVLGFCRANRIPVAVSLAGGYQEDIQKVIDIHCNTFRIAHEVENWDMSTLTSFDHKDFDSELPLPVSMPLQNYSFANMGKVMERQTSPTPVFEEVPEEREREYPGGDFLNEIDDLCALYGTQMSNAEMAEHLEIFIKFLKK